MSPEQQITHHEHYLAKPSELFLIAEGLHVLNNQLYETIKKKDTASLVSLTMHQIASGVNGLAVNLGPSRDMQELMPWVIETISITTQTPLFLSSNIIVCEDILQQHGNRITINAVTAAPDILAQHFKAAKAYNTNIVVLLVKPGLVPTGIDDRLMLAAEVLEMADRIGLPLEQLYLDPVIGCRPDPVAWEISGGTPDIGPVIETISLIKELSQRINTIAGLGNGSAGMAKENRSAFHCRMLPLLFEAGLNAVILNSMDKQLMGVAKRISNSKTDTVSEPDQSLPMPTAA